MPELKPRGRSQGDSRLAAAPRRRTIIGMDTKESSKRRDLENLWTTRPIRPSSGRTVAGVCAGIGNRYRVDPTVVKVAFVVATLFGGSGILVYIAAWLILPSERALSGQATENAFSQWQAQHPHLAYDEWRRTHAHLPLPALDGLARHGLGKGQVIGLIVLAIVGISSFGPNSTWSSSGFVGLGLLAVGWWLLHQRTPTPPIGTSIDTYADAFAQATGTASAGLAVPEPPTIVVPDGGSDAPAASDQTPAPAAPTSPLSTSPLSTPPLTTSPPTPAPSTVTAPVTAQNPPRWDPLGTARFAWDLPEPTTAASVVAQAKKRSPFSFVTYGIAILVAAGGYAASLAGVDWFTPARIAALALAVLGAGLVIAGFRRSTRRHAPGLVPGVVVAMIAVVVLGVTSNFSGLPNGEFGDRSWKPMSENDIATSYQLRAGSLKVDLTGVKLSKDRTLEVRSGVGEIRVRVPQSMAVEANCTSQVGTVKCPTGRVGAENAPVLHLNAHVSMGEVELIRE